MAICVSCGLFVNGDGMLEVKRDPAGHITCSDAGLAVTFPGDDGALAAANAAQASANTALDRVPNKIRWGLAGGSPNAFGTFTFAHGLGGTPSSVVLTPWNSGADQLYHISVENFDAVNVNVKVFKTDVAGFYTSGTFQFYWFAAL